MPASCRTAANPPAPVPFEQHGGRELGDPLRYERLWRRHQHERLLQQPSAAYEQVVFGAALCVVTGIRLVAREMEQLDGRHREIDIDSDAAAQAAEVLGEREPGLVPHDLQDDAVVVRQLDQPTRPCGRLLDDGRDRALDLLGRHADRVSPALVTLGERLLAGQQLRQSLVRSREHRFIGMGRPHAVAPLDLVRVRARLARQHAGVGAQADHLVAQPAVLELVEEQLCVGDERPRVDQRLRLDSRRQLRWTVIGVDDPFDVSAEPQAQPEVALHSGQDHCAEPTALPSCRELGLAHDHSKSRANQAAWYVPDTGGGSTTPREPGRGRIAAPQTAAPGQHAGKRRTRLPACASALKGGTRPDARVERGGKAS
jgi:hypothetical protein